MAGHLSEHHEVTVYNRTEAVAEKWQKQFSGTHASSVAEAAKNQDIVFVCVGKDKDVEMVVFGNHGLLASMKVGSLLIDHTTTSERLAKMIEAEANEHGILFVDAPVSGGEVGARRGQLTVMVGGSKNAFQVAETPMRCYAKFVKHMGDSGKGQLTKMVNQLCISGVLGGLSEGLYFAESAGLDTKSVSEVISGGAAQSWQLDNRAPTMIAKRYDFGFAVDWMRKDLRIILDAAHQLKINLPLAAQVDQQYEHVQSELAGGRWDTSGLIEYYRDKSADFGTSPAPQEIITHEGGCHCGRVVWEVDAPSTLHTHTCNCSICGPAKFQHLITPRDSFRLLSDESHLTKYTFGSGHAKHYFCSTCGVKSFYVPRSNPDGVSVNVNCIKSNTITAIFDQPFDGQNWEENAASLSHLSKSIGVKK